MNKRLFAMVCTLLLLCGGASAEFYTANPDRYYHASADCIAGSTYEISETAARQFEKLACPVCVDRMSIGGELIEIDLPEGYVDLKGVDFKDGKLLLCGDVDWPSAGKPWMAMYDLAGNKLQESLGKPNKNIIRDAKFLSDGKIATIRSLGVDEGECLELYKDGKLMYQSENMHYLSRIWVLEDGFFVYGGREIYEYQLSRCDNDGNILWTRDLTDMFPLSDRQPGLTDILVGKDAHIVWGSKYIEELSDPVYLEYRPVIAALDDDGNILGQHEISKITGEYTKTLYDENMQPTGWETAPSYLQGLGKAVWAENGVIFTGGGEKPGCAMKLGAEGEIWYEHFGYMYDENQNLLLDGKTADSGAIEDIIPWQDGYLLAIGTYIQSEPMYRTEKHYIRMAYMNADGRITRDWFEDIGDILYTEEVLLLREEEEVYLMAYGQLMGSMEAYERGMTQPQIPRKMILKKISA